MGTKKTHDTPAGQRKIADSIENLVPHEFVCIAQAFGIQDPVALQRNSIFERGAEREAGLPKPLDIGEEAEGAGACHLTTKDGGRQIDGLSLLADRGAGEIDFDVEAQACRTRAF